MGLLWRGLQGEVDGERLLDAAGGGLKLLDAAGRRLNLLLLLLRLRCLSYQLLVHGYPVAAAIESFAARGFGGRLQRC